MNPSVDETADSYKMYNNPMTKPDKDDEQLTKGVGIKDNLSNDNVGVTIKPETDNNKVNICSFTIICNCFSGK